MFIVKKDIANVSFHCRLSDCFPCQHSKTNPKGNRCYLEVLQNAMLPFTDAWQGTPVSSRKSTGLHFPPPPCTGREECDVGEFSPAHFASALLGYLPTLPLSWNWQTGGPVIPLPHTRTRIPALQSLIPTHISAFSLLVLLGRGGGMGLSVSWFWQKGTAGERVWSGQESAHWHQVPSLPPLLWGRMELQALEDWGLTLSSNFHMALPSIFGGWRRGNEESHRLPVFYHVPQLQPQFWNASPDGHSRGYTLVCSWKTPFLKHFKVCLVLSITPYILQS